MVFQGDEVPPVGGDLPHSPEHLFTSKLEGNAGAPGFLHYDGGAGLECDEMRLDEIS